MATSAPSTITISGQTVTVSGSSTTPLGGVSVAAFVGSSSTAAATTTSNGSGDYSLNVSTGGAPVAAYLRGRTSGDLDMYLYPAIPVYKDSPNVPLVMVTQADLDFLAVSASVSQSSSKGFVTVVVVDCLGNEVSGATVSVSPSSGTTIRYLSGGQPSTSASSTDSTGSALIFNAPTGSVTIGANAGGMTLRAHAINVRSDTITATVVQP